MNEVSQMYHNNVWWGLLKIEECIESYSYSVFKKSTLQAKQVIDLNFPPSGYREAIATCPMRLTKQHVKYVYLKHIYYKSYELQVIQPDFIN